MASDITVGQAALQALFHTIGRERGHALESTANPPRFVVLGANGSTVQATGQRCRSHHTAHDAITGKTQDTTCSKGVTALSFPEGLPKGAVIVLGSLVGDGKSGVDFCPAFLAYVAEAGVGAATMSQVAGQMRRDTVVPPEKQA